MITRPTGQAGPLSDMIIALGGEPILLPTIATEPFDDLSGWTSFAENLAKFSWIIFTSENGVTYFMEQLSSRNIEIEKLENIKIAAIGRGTTASLASYKLKPNFVPSRAVVDNLVAEMPEQFDLSGNHILRVRGNLADSIIEDRFPSHGAEVMPLTVYRTFHPIWSKIEKDKFLENLPDAVLFTSGSTVLGLLKNLDANQFDKLQATARIFSIGPKVSAVLKGKNILFAGEATEQNIDGLIALLRDHFISN